MVTDGSGQLSWSDPPSDGDWLVSDSVLYTGNYWGLARGGVGNELYGDSAHTHVNFGIACTTGSAGNDYQDITIAGGYQNVADNNYAVVSGGRFNRVLGVDAFIGGGSYNRANSSSAVVCGGTNNSALGTWSFVGGGSENEANGDYACVGGGTFNITGADYAFIGGGSSNSVSGLFGTVAGGGGNFASAMGAAVSGGYENRATSDYTFVGCGYYNRAEAVYAVIGGGYYNRVLGDYSAILGGYADTIAATADYSYLFGINSNLTQDSTFMVDMPHIWFGTEAAGYEFPITDGTADQVMVTDGSGQLSWANQAANDTDWVFSGSNIYSGVSGNVGIGNPTPSYKLDVTGKIRCSDTLIALTEIITPVIRGAGSNPLEFKTAGTTRLSILASGDIEVSNARLEFPTGSLNLPTWVTTTEGDIWYSGGNVQYRDASATRTLLTTANAFMQNGNSFGTAAILGTNDAQSLQFETNGTSHVTISSAGNVGIGNPSPIYKLDVTGDMRATGRLYIEDIYDGSYYLDPDDVNWSAYLAGNISCLGGIHVGGTSAVNDDDLFVDGNTGLGGAPTNQRLYVNGDMRLTGAFYDGNNESGTSGQILSSTGTGTDWVDAPPQVSYLAYNSGDDAISASTFTKVEFNIEDHDDGTNYNTTNDRFIVPSDGVYHFSISVQFNDLDDASRVMVALYKNGARYMDVASGYANSTGDFQSFGGSVTIKLLTDDYIEIYALTTSTSASISGIQRYTNFSGHQVY